MNASKIEADIVTFKDISNLYDIYRTEDNYLETFSSNDRNEYSLLIILILLERCANMTDKFLK